MHTSNAVQGIRLIGFKPYDKVERHLFVKPGRFIYPNEIVSYYIIILNTQVAIFGVCIQDISGSSRTFSAFLDCCINKQVVPICCYVATANTQPRFVGLFPQVMFLLRLLVTVRRINLQ